MEVINIGCLKLRISVSQITMFYHNTYVCEQYYIDLIPIEFIGHHVYKGKTVFANQEGTFAHGLCSRQEPAA